MEGEPRVNMRLTFPVQKTLSLTVTVESRMKMESVIPEACADPPQILLLLLFYFNFIHGKTQDSLKRIPEDSIRTVCGMECGNQACFDHRYQQFLPG